MSKNNHLSHGAMPLKIRFLRELAQALIEELRELDEPRQLRVEHGINLPEEVGRFEAELIRCALNHTGGHQVRAARLLGLKTTTLNNKIKQYRIQIDKASGVVKAAPRRRVADARREDARLLG